jgi:hypothetical protein
MGKNQTQHLRVLKEAVGEEMKRVRLVNPRTIICSSLNHPLDGPRVEKRRLS